ncbi:hypothetical protein EV356DRAFT_342861 [Viridothelium virens]|uniref:Uncharacterized protein n=1 Tax=Viridothelium virens TaxID=1048519 RepID=A0A6A6GYQ2_VIRVR|nr:hypothetical protein EV356DRAFT_342861 [Viridothelium virens]
MYLPAESAGIIFAFVSDGSEYKKRASQLYFKSFSEEWKYQVMDLADIINPQTVRISCKLEDLLDASFCNIRSLGNPTGVNRHPSLKKCTDLSFQSPRSCFPWIRLGVCATPLSQACKFTLGTPTSTTPFSKSADIIRVPPISVIAAPTSTPMTPTIAGLTRSATLPRQPTSFRSKSVKSQPNRASYSLSGPSGGIRPSKEPRLAFLSSTDSSARGWRIKYRGNR